MFNLIDLTQMVVAVIGLLSASIAAYLVPYLKVKINSEKWNQWQEITFVAVSAAEQLGTGKKINDKFVYAKTYVQDELDKRGIKYDEYAVKTAIEAAVKQLFPKV